MELDVKGQGTAVCYVLSFQVFWGECAPFLSLALEGMISCGFSLVHSSHWKQSVLISTVCLVCLSASASVSSESGHRSYGMNVLLSDFTLSWWLFDDWFLFHSSSLCVCAYMYMCIYMYPWMTIRCICICRLEGNIRYFSPLLLFLIWRQGLSLNLEPSV